MAEIADTAEEKPVTLGRVGKTHGIKGWVRLYSYTEPAGNIACYRRFRRIQPGRQSGPAQDELEMDQVQTQGDHLVAHFVGYDDPDAAQRLVGVELQVSASELPELAADEYYWHQLIGLAVINQQGQLLGEVVSLLETGANDVLVIKPGQDSIDSHERLIPYLRESVVRAVDLDSGRLEVDWDADFLL